VSPAREGLSSKRRRRGSHHRRRRKTAWDENPSSSGGDEGAGGSSDESHREDEGGESDAAFSSKGHSSTSREDDSDHKCRPARETKRSNARDVTGRGRYHLRRKRTTGGEDPVLSGGDDDARSSSYTSYREDDGDGSDSLVSNNDGRCSNEDVSEESADDSPPPSNKRQTHESDVIEIDDSTDSDSVAILNYASRNASDAEISPDQGMGSSTSRASDDAANQSSDESENESTPRGRSNQLKNHCDNHRAKTTEDYDCQGENYHDSSGSENNSDSDEDDAHEEVALAKYHTSRLTRSNMRMAAQGFQFKANVRLSPASGNGSEKSANRDKLVRDCTPFDPSSVTHSGRAFYKNKCYVMVTAEGDVTVGIRRFVTNAAAQCILLAKFEDTLLGLEDKGTEYQAERDTKDTYVQIHEEVATFSLSKLGRPAEDVDQIPRLIYQPQTHGDWYTFGYFHDRKRLRKTGMRPCPRTLELFAGAGGSLLGYKNSGFDTSMAVENDVDAALTLKKNHKGLKVYEGCIKEFMKDYAVLKYALGPSDHVSVLI
jgi:hypothetical protein